MTLVAAVVEVVTAEAGIITSGIEVGLRDMGIPLQRGDASKGARAAVDRKLIERVPCKQAESATPLPQRSSTPERPRVPPEVTSEYPRVPYRDGGY